MSMTSVEIAIHTILYVRQVYPAEIFVRRQKLGIPLFQCSKPELYSYISGLIESVAEEVLNVRSSRLLSCVLTLNQGEVERLIVNVHDRDSIVETFTFLISHATEEPRSRLVGTSIMQGQMRSMLRKLNAIDSQLIPLNDLGMSRFLFCSFCSCRLTFPRTPHVFGDDSNVTSITFAIDNGISMFRSLFFLTFVKT